MQQDEKCHARSAKALVDGHLLASGYRKGYGLRVAVEQVDVTRAARERTWRMDAVPNVLYAVWCVAGNYPTRGLVVKSKRWNPGILAVKHSRLAVRGGRGQATEPSPQRKSFTEQPRDRWAETELECPPQVRVGEGVDLQHDEPALRRTRTLFAREGA